MQHDIYTARRFADRGVIERVNLYHRGMGGCAGCAARTHQAGHDPAGIAERLRSLVAQPTGGAEHQDTRTHDRPLAKGIRGGPASRRAIVRVAPVISNAAGSIIRSRINGGRSCNSGDSLSIREGAKKLPMSEFLIYALVPMAIGAVAVVLLLGLHNMAR